MKKLLLCMAFFSVLGIKAQENVMIVDNQTPGWLSSLMTYSQQTTVEDLTVTGYVNKTDMEFICNIIKKHNLKILNLYSVNVVKDDAEDNVLWSGFIDFGNTKRLQKIIMPINIWGVNYLDSFQGIIHSAIDSVIISSPLTFNVIFQGETLDEETAWLGTMPKYVELPEGVRCLKSGIFRWGGNGTKSFKVSLPNSLEIIDGNAFENCPFDEPIILPPNIVRLGRSTSNIPYRDYGYNGFSWIKEDPVDQGPLEVPISKNRYDFPDSLVVCYGGQQTTNGSSYFNPYLLYSSDTIVVGEKCDTLTALLKGNVGYFKTKNPPIHQAGAYDFDILYVPKGCVENYKSVCGSYLKTIKEIQNVTDVVINPGKMDLEINDEVFLNASIMPNDAFDKSLSWKSSDENVALVDANGKVTALQPGEVVISAIARDGGVEGTCHIRVLQHATGISIDYSEVEMNEIGSKFQLTASVSPENSYNKEVEWMSSNIAICHVSNNGLLTATGYGTTVIFATTVDGGYSASCVVKVKELSGITDNENETHDSFNRFTINGIKVEKPVRGINIIKYSNGETKKIVAK